MPDTSDLVIKPGDTGTYNEATFRDDWTCHIYLDSDTGLAELDISRPADVGFREVLLAQRRWNANLPSWVLGIVRHEEDISFADAVARWQQAKAALIALKEQHPALADKLAEPAFAGLAGMTLEPF